MIDNLSLLISHGLLALLCWRLLPRTDLDREPPASDSPAIPARPHAVPVAWRRLRGAAQPVAGKARRDA